VSNRLNKSEFGNSMRKKAFTLIELIVVISVVALLMAILIPVLAEARQQGIGIVCLNNLRQMTMAAQVYTETFDGYYPIAQYVQMTPGQNFLYCWDFTVIVEPGKRTVVPGLLWQQQMMEEIQQCPSFRGVSNTLMDPYTGYNYNTSYIGHGQGESIPTPIKAVMVKRPDRCALFGDGEWQTGANKYMRAPWPSPGDMTFTGRSAGTQGYRHLHKTNVAFCDGHSQSWDKCYKNTVPADVDKIAEGTGFLSPDNSLYDLE
jgi:prepilin-type N-terminal cleavage/methylation domain-containing protein/prepilin-type processing-associated H-X9-DG protein